jgi:small subunit ribosomal protein S21
MRRDALAVRPRAGEPIENVIRRFGRRVRDSGLVKELRERSSYVKPSVRRRMKRSRAAFKRRHDRE